MDEIEGTPTELHIDQQKYFAFHVDDVDAAQANVNLVDDAMARASYALRDVIDQYIASFHKSAGVEIGSSTTPINITTADAAYGNLVNLKGALDDANVPSEGRWGVFRAGSMV